MSLGIAADTRQDRSPAPSRAVRPRNARGRDLAMTEPAAPPPSPRTAPPTGGDRRTGFAWFLISIGAGALAIGLWGMKLGWETLKWPRVEAEIVDSKLTIRDARPSRSPSGMGPLTSYNREEFAAYATTFRYEVNGEFHIAHGVERGGLGLQNSAKSRALDEAHPIGSRAMVVVDPADPDDAYLVAGPSSAAKMATGVGTAFVLIGLWVRSAILQANRRSRRRRRAPPDGRA